MKQQTTTDPLPSRVCFDSLEVHIRQVAQKWMQRILEEEVEHLPVLVGDRLVGICTRTDILRARRRQFEHERAQKGWRPRFRSSASP